MKLTFLLIFQIISIYTYSQILEVKKIEAAILKAYMQKDTQSIKKYVDDQFILVHADGMVQSKQDFVNAYTFFKPEDKFNISSEHRKTINKNDLFILNGIVLSQWKEGDKTLRSKTSYTDTYKKINGKWLLISSYINDIGEEFYAITDTNGIKDAIAKQYEILDRSVEKKDLCTHLGLKTSDFSTVDHLGNRGSAKFMRHRSKLIFNAMRDSIQTKNTIETITFAGDTTKVVVHQSFNRNQLMAGKVRRVETSARQRESWMLTRDGWKLVFVDQVQPLTRVVDGKPTDPTKPFNPNDPLLKN